MNFPLEGNSDYTYIASHYFYLTLLEFDSRLGSKTLWQKVYLHSLLKDNPSLKFYGIFTRSWMVTCMLFMKKCSLWSSCIEYKRNVVWRTTKWKDYAIWIFAWSKLINLKYKIIILNLRHEHRQDFNVYIKQYNTETNGEQRINSEV